jgi:phenylpropionate dioxygenase-like ring-hydroxylating dioxygenase large terminal subunit
MHTSQHFPGLVDLREKTVSPLVYIDRDVYQAEQELIFAKSWLYVGHESQLPNDADFIVASMGEVSVLVWRRAEGRIGVYLNSCPHRGMRVCREESGRARTMVCPYHGWSFDQKGALRGVPNFEDSYAGLLDKSKWGLIPVARVETYRGLIFACFDPDVVPLVDYLGHAKWYLDAALNGTANGLKALPGVHRWQVDANWKFGAENAAGDNAHAAVVHASVLPMFDPLEPGAKPFDHPFNHEVKMGNGHGWLALNQPPERDPVVAAHVAKVREEAAGRLTPKQLEQYGKFYVGTIFPNLSFFFAGTPTIRVWQPRGVNRMEVWSWTFAEGDPSAEVVEAQRRNMTTSFSASGLVEQEDGLMWSSCQRELESGVVRRRHVLNYAQGANNTYTEPDRPGVLGKNPTEIGIFGFYERWHADMGGTQ